MIDFKNFKLEDFLKLDIRWKLRRISKLTKIPLYPKFFVWTGIRGIYSKFIFNLVFFGEVLKKKKLIIKELKRKLSKSSSRINFLISPPSSGSTYLRSLLTSYFAIYHKVDNGIPKFNNLTQRWTYAASPIVKAALFDHIELEIVREIKRENFFSKEEFNKKKVFFTRYPFDKPDLFKLEDMKPVILIREPFDWLVSTYTQHNNIEDSKFFKIDSVNHKLIRDQLSKIDKYISCWLDYLSKTQNEFLLIKYEQIVSEPLKYFSEVLKLFDYGVIDRDIIQRVIEINSKDFALKSLGTKYHGTRFKDVDLKEINRKNIREIAEEIIQKKEIDKKYEQLIKFKKEL